MATDPRRLLERLEHGNVRFLERVAADRKRQAELVRGQQPYAAVLTCADSRVAPELLFDVGLGELFVVRVAGNVAHPEAIASIEFAVADLGTRLVVVLAHESCVAVAAALQGSDDSPCIRRVVAHIAPAIPMAEASDVDAVARQNARLSARNLTAESEILREAVDRDGLRIATAFFHLSTGVVEFD